MCLLNYNTVNEGLGERISRVFMQQQLQEVDPMWAPLGANIQSTPSKRVNVMIALTGRAAYLGRGIEVAVKKAVQDVCAHDDQKPCSLDVKYYDTQSSPSKALSLFQQGYSDGVRVFIGLITSGEAKAVAEYAATHAPQAVIISPSSTATELCNYKQLYRLTMDDRGFAEALYDMSMEMASNLKITDKLPIYVLHLNDLHGQGLVSDIEEIFKLQNADFDALFTISYSNEQNAINALSKLSTATAHAQYAIIVLAGLQPDAKFILNESKKFNHLIKFPWVVSDMIALSNIDAPEGMTLYGLTYQGSFEDDLSRKKRSQSKLKSYLNDKEISPMVQPLLAYDAVNVVYQAANRDDNKHKFQFEGHAAYQGVSGTIDFSSCHERASGEYSLSARKSEDNLESAIMVKTWIFLAQYKISAAESSQEEFQIERASLAAVSRSKVRWNRSLGPSMTATMAEDITKTTKVDITSTNAGVAAVYRSELLHALSSAKSVDCQNSATIVVSTRDDALSQPINSTYSLNTFPEVLMIPTQYGFILDGSCLTNSERIQVVKVCPSAGAAGTELSCTIKKSHIPKNALAMAGQISTGLYIVAGVCYVGAVACYAFSLFAPAGCGNWQTGCGSILGVANSARSGGKYVCTELFRQGYMSPELMLADMNFALTYTRDHPVIRKGYDILGPFVASLMKDSETITEIARYIAIPWAEEMAYQEGYRNEGNEFGKWVMSVGSVVCGVVGGVYTYLYAIGITVQIILMVVTSYIIYKKRAGLKHIKTE